MPGYRLMTPLDPQCDMGKEMAVIFNLGRIRSAKYGEAELAGHFLHLLPFGKYPKLVTDYVEQAEKELLALVKKIGLVQYDKFEQWLSAIQIVWLSTRIAPNANPERLKLVYYIQLTIFLIGDIINTQCFKLAVAPTQQDKNEIIELFVRVLRGHCAWVEEISKLDFSVFKPVCELLLIMRQTALLSLGDISYFIEEVVTWLRSIIWEKDEQDIDENSYLFLRLMCVAVYPSIEAILLAQEISVAKEIREHFLYKKYTYQAVSYIGLFNDIFSVKKEIDQREIRNLVFTKFKKYANLQISIDEAVKIANQLLLDMKITGIKLKSCFVDNSAINKIVDTIACMVDGFLYWHPESLRYGQADCRYVTMESSDNLSGSHTKNLIRLTATPVGIRPANNLNHIAIIVDGNRRWAKMRGISVENAHQVLVYHIPNLAKAAWKLGISTISFWVLSPDNLQRRVNELQGLLHNLENVILHSVDMCHNMQARLYHLGLKEQLPQSLVQKLVVAENETKNYENDSNRLLNLAINYGGRQEIIQAIHKLFKSKSLADEVTEAELAKFLYTGSQKYPDPDLIIRTGCDANSARLSGFMNWQNSYSELSFSAKHFPEFSINDLQAAIRKFSTIERRFGK